MSRWPSVPARSRGKAGDFDLTDMSYDGLAAEAYGARASGLPSGLSRGAMLGVGAAIALGWLSMSVKFVDVDALKAEVLHARPGLPDATSVPVGLVSEAHAATAPDSGTEILKTGFETRHPALLDRSDLAHASTTDRKGRVEAAESHIFEQPEALTQQAFSLRFKTYDASFAPAQAVAAAAPAGGDVVVASLEPRAERFGGNVDATENAPLRAALEARRDGYQPDAALAVEAALDPDAFVLPLDVPLPTLRPQTVVATAPAQEPATAVAQEVLTAPEPASPSPSRALLAVVESLPSVAPLVARVKPAAPAKPSGTTKIIEMAKVPEKNEKKSKARVLAYATPDLENDKKGNGGGMLANLFGDGPKKAITPGRRKGVAIYDISTATVHMPNGEKLEAHSGLGHMKDNPKYADRRMNGPTPPNVYNLRMREARYHGVEAIRMLPTDHKRMHGRNGILAHTSLVRGTNGSHGCVAFKDYNKFLKAFKRGEVTKMVVVPRMSEAKVYLASL